MREILMGRGKEQPLCNSQMFLLTHWMTWVSEAVVGPASALSSLTLLQLLWFLGRVLGLVP